MHLIPGDIWGSFFYHALYLGYSINELLDPIAFIIRVQLFTYTVISTVVSFNQSICSSMVL